MEEQKTYTYEKDARKPVNKAKVFLAVIAVLVLSAATASGVFIGKNKADKESEAASEAASLLAAETTTSAVEVYPVGEYVIKTGGYTLLLREQPSKGSADRAEIPDKTAITISEIAEDPDATDENYRFWGKTSYEGETGWVPMKYLVAGLS